MLSLVSTYVVCETLSVMHKQVSVQLTSNSTFLSKFSRKPLSGILDQRVPLKWKTSDLRWPKFTQKYSPPPMKNFRYEMTKGYSKISPPQWKTSDLRWTKFTPKYPTPQNEKLQNWDHQRLLQNTPPPPMKNFRFEMTKVYSEIPPLGLEFGRSHVETKSVSPDDTISFLCYCTYRCFIRFISIQLQIIIKFVLTVSVSELARAAQSLRWIFYYFV